MAYVDTKKKVIILYPHKTGTHTLRQILLDHGKIDKIYTENQTNHPSIKQLDIPNVDEYQVYAFYREPVEKFLSFMAFNYRKYSHMVPVSNVMEYVSKYGYFVPQVRWLNPEEVKVNLLDYADFENEMRKVLRIVGIPDNIHIPRLNASDNRRTVNDLTPEEVTYIKEFYKQDYEFFESRGITFKV